MSSPSPNPSDNVATRQVARARDGFLPFYTNAFDRAFIGVVILIGIHLLWLRFLEAALPLELATLLSLLIGAVVLRRG